MIEMIVLKKRNFKLGFEWDWKEFGLGWIIYKPMYPHSNYYVGISVRVLWLLMIFKFWERKQIHVGFEIRKEVEKGVKIPEIYVKQLTKFKGNNEAYLVWNWEYFGLMIYLNQPKDLTQTGVFILNIMWLVIVFDLA